MQSFALRGFSPRKTRSKKQRHPFGCPYVISRGTPQFADLSANKRIFLMSYDITLLLKDEKFALNSLRKVEILRDARDFLPQAAKNQVCLWQTCPLQSFALRGFSPRKTRSKKQRHPFGCLCFLWSGLRGSNPPPSPWQGDALPNELNPHFVVPPVGIEPTTRGFSVPCSTN